jgi:ParB-like chromosome segregation protein Spo0J
MTKLVIVYKATADLIPYAQNSRTHSAAQVNQIDASIEQFGFTNPILIDETGCVIAGHGRLLAANQRGMLEVPTITLVGLTDAQRRAYVIADNRIALNSGWDYKLLASELAAVQSAGGAVDNLGFSDSEILNMIGSLNPANAKDPDAAPALAKQAVTVLGDMWLLGDHKLLCADATDSAQAQILCVGGGWTQSSPTRPITSPTKAKQKTRWRFKTTACQMHRSKTF